MFILEGNIGAGKSTFLALIAQYLPEITVIQEPVNNWTAERGGQSLLKEFYQDPARWAYTFETYTMVFRALDHMRHQNTVSVQPRLMERSIYSGHYCFARNGRAQGFFSDIEWDLYNHWANFIIHQKCNVPKGFIYLQASPETCFARVQKRSRAGEQSLPLSYLQEIHEWHENFLVDRENLELSLANVPVLVLPVEQEFIRQPSVARELLEQVRGFLDSVEAGHQGSLPHAQTLSVLS